MVRHLAHVLGRMIVGGRSPLWIPSNLYAMTTDHRPARALQGHWLHSQICVATAMIHLDDFAPGQVYPLAAQPEPRRDRGRGDWDLQPFHLDEQAAAGSIYGGVIASGWARARSCVWFADYLLNRSAAMGSPGVDEVRWLPAWSAWRITDARLEVRRSIHGAQPDRGIVRLRR